MYATVNTATCVVTGSNTNTAVTWQKDGSSEPLQQETVDAAGEKTCTLKGFELAETASYTCVVTPDNADTKQTRGEYQIVTNKAGTVFST